MSASFPATTSPPLAGPAIHRGPAIARLISGSLSRRPLPAYTAQTVSASAASTAPKPRGLLLRCRAGEGAVPGQVEAPLKVMISGAPASGKGTQCRMIVEKYGLVHISTGDLLRAEVSSGSDIGNKAKEYMDNGMLVPDQVVTDMVVSRLSQPDVREKGWLLDGYPRSYAQAQSLESMKIRPDIFVVLEVPDDNLIDRCVGRRLDPVTGKIYHVKNFPPENEEISARLLTRSDDTFEKVKSRLETYKQNSEAVLPTYSDLLNQIDGNRPVEVVFHEIDSLLQKIRANASEDKLAKSNGKPPDSLHTAASKNEYRGIPTRLNNIPHSREIRKYFYDDVLQATKRAIEDKKTRLQIDINIPELNPEMDVYRIGTLMELVRDLSLTFANDGKRVKVCVQGSMGQGAFAGIPLQLAGTRKILEIMDWGDYGAKGAFINIGAVGASEVDKEDDMFVLIAPQNAVGNCIIDDMKAMTDAAGNRPVILVNPRLKDMPASSGVMQTMGRDMRLQYAASFETCYSFRLLFYAGTFYPIMGALRMAYPNKYEIYRRVDEPNGKEKYSLLAEFTENPTADDITNAFKGPKKEKENASSGFWGFLSGIL
ncbi:probable adenylate kinase 5, chloroplastic isoform X1 [Lolium perenne]|uniref:probable adenylate kinase 5, chloroplastic isoform X1 n=1 Tax=Lolium perenne TaxID=4522 RepID=UPI0021F50C42|nr:probable adenylate kinase 5, chloroplastic [Lolium perenne]XP_051187137.1 probable adenylate kinase 5, chloroplastic [Lolium perenne]XP_051187138.1 probable adenylate kinase 5, chloroplastic [Lolium perenne]